MNGSKKSLFYALAAVVLWSTVATAFKLALRGLSPLQLLFWASVASAAALSVIAYKTDKSQFFEQFTRKYFFRNMLFGALNPFLYYFVLFKAYDLLPAQEAQPLNYTWPIAVSVFSALFLGEKFKRQIFAGMLISFAGIVVIATRGDFAQLKFENPLGVSLALASAFVWAIFWTLKLKDKRNDAAKLFASFFYGSVISGVYLVLVGDFILPETEFLLAAIYVGLFEMGITFFLWLKALGLSENKSKTSTLAYFSPFLSLFFIATVLGEDIRASSVAGLLLIIGGILIQRVKINGNKIK